MVIKWTVLVFFVLVVVITALTFYGNHRWQAETASLHERMAETSGRIAAPVFAPQALHDLPDQIQRYFKRVIGEGRARYGAAHIVHEGTFNMGESDAQWRPFQSTQRVNLSGPGFVWDARIRMAPLMNVHVHDAYVAGEGILTAKLFGLITVMQQPQHQKWRKVN